ncbi:hypothetical protein P3C22_13195 [Pseudomonas sp. ER28]|uniref:hypothetical protein n=1 Tax=Pseudomonas sp. ER28 TaxID=3033801 RepID=UPI0023DFFD73|nr:hypothetical protein [Pseudomonas sp. ER28]MDF3172990.1 hypothetical protein [Pseudomonas sp. ER28]
MLFTTRLMSVSVPLGGGASEVQEVAEDVLDALQRHFGVGVWHFAEVEQQIVEGLQDVVVALGVRERLAIFIMFY